MKLKEKGSWIELCMSMGTTLHKKQVDKEHGSEMHKIAQIKVTQNRRKTEVLEGNVWRSSSPNPTKAGSPISGCTGTYPGSFLSISRGYSTVSLGHLFQCSVTLQVKKFMLMFSSSLFPLPLVLLLNTIEKSLTPSFWNGVKEKSTVCSSYGQLS